MEKVLRPEIITALETVEKEAYQNADIDNDTDYILCYLALAYRELGREETASRTFTNAAAQSIRGNCPSFPYVAAMLSLNGFGNDADRLVEQQIDAAKNASGFDRLMVVTQFVTLTQLTKKETFLTITEELLPVQLSEREDALRWIAEGWGSIEDDQKSLEGIQKLDAPYQVNAWVSRACTLAYRGDANNAYYALSMAVQTADPPNIPPLQKEYLACRIASAYTALGNVQRAQEIADKAGLDGLFRTLLNEYWAIQLAKEKRYDEALDCAAKIESHDSWQRERCIENRLKILLAIAEFQYNGGHIQEANDRLIHVRQEIMEKQVHYLLPDVAQWYVSVNDTEKAIPAFTEAYRLLSGYKGTGLDWKVVVSRTIVAQAKAGLANE